MLLKITQLTIYPVKSLAGLSVNNLAFDRLGAKYDRRYMLINAKGQFVTQRQYSQLSLITLKAVDGGWELALPLSLSHQHTSIFLPYEGKLDQARKVNVWNDVVEAFDQGAVYAKFFSGFLNESVRLVYMPESSMRVVDEMYCEERRYVSFADGFPLLLCHEASLIAVNALLDQEIPMSRFRPNIVVSSSEPAFSELTWRILSEDDPEGLFFDIVKPCSRCVIPCIDPKTGEKQPAIWQALKSLCQAEDGLIYFGQNMLHKHLKPLVLGDELLAKV